MINESRGTEQKNLAEENIRTYPRHWARRHALSSARARAMLSPPSGQASELFTPPTILLSHYSMHGRAGIGRTGGRTKTAEG
eukprot:4619481-Pleurochrysis_carterae.AAC.2